MSTASARNWGEVVFDEIIEDSAFGPRFSGDAYDENGNIATLRTTDISEDGRISYETMPLAQLDEASFAKHLLKINDLVITRSGRVGTTALFTGYHLPVLPGAFLIRFRLSDKANPDFYRYWFNSRVGQQRLSSVSRGAAQQNINITNVRTLQVPLPPLPVQSRIASILSAYDDLIENNRRRIQLLEQAARLLYKEWFVHLRFPGHEHTKIHNGIPEGWEKKTLGELLTLQRGFDLPSSQRKDGHFPIYASTGINGYHIEAKVKGPGVVTGRSGSLGTVMFVPGDFWPLNTTLWVKEFKLIGPHFATHLLNNMQLEQYNGGAAVPTLNRNDVHRVEVLCPPPLLIQFFEDHAKDVTPQIDILKSMIVKLESARDLLLPRLMNGELAV